MEFILRNEYLSFSVFLKKGVIGERLQIESLWGSNSLI